MLTAEKIELRNSELKSTAEHSGGGEKKPATMIPLGIRVNR
jgi:hypothetical protein